MKSSIARLLVLGGLACFSLNISVTVSAEEPKANKDGLVSRPKDEIWEEVQKHNALIMQDSVTKGELGEKLAKMSESAFAFYRATAHLFYRDIVLKVLKMPIELEGRADLHTWISGDYHVQNIGFEPAGGAQRRFELNDFDETCRAPFHWDICRFLTSLYLVQDSAGWPAKELPFPVSNTEADLLAFSFVNAYRQTVAANAIESLTAAELDAPTDQGKRPALNAFVHESLALGPTKLQKKEKDFWKDIAATPQGFSTAGPDYAPVAPALLTEIKQRWGEYLASLDPAFVAQAGHAYFHPVAGGTSHAIKLKAGLGSLGVIKVWLVIQGPTADDKDNIVLEAKASYPAAPVETGAVPATGMPEGRRVSEGTRQMIINEDPTEGFFDAGGYSFHVTRISPLSGGKKLKEFETLAHLQDYVHWAGVAVANAHCRADARFAHAVHGVLKRTPGLAQAFGESCKQYAKQVSADHAAFAASHRDKTAAGQ